MTDSTLTYDPLQQMQINALDCLQTQIKIKELHETSDTLYLYICTTI